MEIRGVVQEGPHPSYDMLGGSQGSLQTLGPWGGGGNQTVREETHQNDGRVLLTRIL